jgi:cellulose synthase/poly-beta-1,6-N-acetylglucosamine synthase-like glycosyltransferase
MIEGRAGSLAWLPSVDVLVCVYNEASYIEDKLANLAALVYRGAGLHIIVVDGGSDDGTPELVRGWSERHGIPIEIVSTSAVGKPAQINAGLAHCHGDWVLVTDADARLPPMTVREMVERAAADDRVSVVGTAIRPHAGHPLDHAHWTVANALLRLESRLGTTGLVVGPCYMVRRSLFEPLPADTVADDVRVSCRTLLAGRRIACAPVTVTELRTPVGGRELFRHKMRKARGYMHEVRASLPSIRLAAPLPLAVFMWRAALLVGPPAALVTIMLAISATAGTVHVLAAGLSAAVIGVVSLRGRPGRAHPPGLLRTWIGLPIVASAVLLAAICTRPFTSLSPRYPRIQLADRAREV